MKANNGTTRNDTQFSVFLANKPTVLARVCQQLADDKINILALSMMDSTEHGVLRLVAESPDRARQCLARLNVPTAETTVLLTTLPNRPGALADIVQRLANNHIGVTYAYCTAAPPAARPSASSACPTPKKPRKSSRSASHAGSSKHWRRGRPPPRDGSSL
jgi:hypothetical protein